MSGTLSELIGGGGVPIGASILALDAPVNFSQSGQEYLRTGSIKLYDASYAPSIAAAPQLRVFGNNARTYGTTVNSPGSTVRYCYISGVYVATSTNGSTRYGATLSSLAVSAIGGQFSRKLSASTTHLLLSGNANSAPAFTTNGNTNTAVGGSFTTFPLISASVFGNNSWLTLSSLNGVAGEQGYINNANPSGVWMVGASTAIGMTAANGLAYGAGVFVAVGSSASETSGKIATIAIVGSAWTDRTASSGVLFAAAESVDSITWSGSNFVAVTSTARILTSTNGTTWVDRGSVYDASPSHPLSGLGSWTGGGISTVELTTDGAGVIVACIRFNTATARPLISISYDNGATWGSAQLYIGKVGIANARTISYANGRWIANFSGDPQSCVDIGASIATPDYIGNQYQLGAGQFVRIK